MAENRQVVVIGSGFGGLSASVYLASKGFDVTVIEKNDKPGGKADELLIQGFRFDTGPSLLTMPFVIEQLFESAGKKLSNYIELIQPNIICKYFYNDKTIINAYSDINRFADEIQSKTKDSAKSIKKYLKYSEQIYNLTADLFLFNDFTEVKNLLTLKSFKTLLNINKIDPFRTMHQANSGFFTDERTVQLFDRYATYNGSNPYKAPATLNIIQHVEYNLGGFLPKYGIYSLVEAIYKLAKEIGVKFLFGSEVKKIETYRGVLTGINYTDKNKINRIINTDRIISNADVRYSYNFLLDNLKAKRSVTKQEPSSSAIVFYWGISKEFYELNIHNILFSANYKEEFNDLFNKRISSDDPTVYIYISSKYNLADAPEGMENWFVMINYPYSFTEITKDEINKIKKSVIRKIENTLNSPIEKYILFEEILTPNKIELKTNSIGGSLYGISSNNKNSAFLRHKNYSPFIKNLYFAGGSVHPGGGIPLVILSGKIAAEKIIRDYDKG